ncbi:MAG TPA: hypothetical protein VLG46_14540 [Anaerolineae bacterium]|nr:hypothetical protein [Anaerolineae bacterium]
MKRTMIFVALLFVLILDWAALAQAQSDDGSIYDLNWYTIDGGGGAISNEAYMLNGTIGQADAATLLSGGYTLVGGFWSGGVVDYEIYLPLLMK